MIGEAGPEVSLEELVVGHGRHRVAGPLTASWRGGSLYAITGPNGVGKTTLLRCVLGLLRPLAGRVRRSTGLTRSYVPQIGVLDEGFPITVGEVVALGVRTRGRRHRRSRVVQALEAVGLADRRRRSFFALSGGQRQRVLIARALVADAGFVALDEPTAGVDLESSEIIWRLLRDIAERGQIVVVVTHDLFMAPTWAHQVLMLDREGIRVREAPDG